MKNYYNVPWAKVFWLRLIEQIESLYEKTHLIVQLSSDYKDNMFESIDLYYEAKEIDCKKDIDWLWILKDSKWENKKFLWRLEPSYNCNWKPYYWKEQLLDFYNKSENTKCILKTNTIKVNLVLNWFVLWWEYNWGIPFPWYHVEVFYKWKKTFSWMNCLKKWWKKELTDFTEKEFIYITN